MSLSSSVDGIKTSITDAVRRAKGMMLRALVARLSSHGSPSAAPGDGDPGRARLYTVACRDTRDTRDRQLIWTFMASAAVLVGMQVIALAQLHAVRALVKAVRCDAARMEQGMERRAEVVEMLCAPPHLPMPPVGIALAGPKTPDKC